MLFFTHSFNATRSFRLVICLLAHQQRILYITSDKRNLKRTIVSLTWSTRCILLENTTKRNHVLIRHAMLVNRSFRHPWHILALLGIETAFFFLNLSLSLFQILVKCRSSTVLLYLARFPLACRHVING